MDADQVRPQQPEPPLNDRAEQQDAPPPPPPQQQRPEEEPNFMPQMFQRQPPQQQQQQGFPLEEWYFEIPPVTRTFATLVVATTVACQMELTSPLKLYYDEKLIFQRRQYWRIVTNFLYFGQLGLDFMFYLFFLTRYCRMLEEGSFRGRTWDFVWMLLIGAIGMMLVEPLVHMPFLGSSLTFMMVYVWSRRNPDVRLNFLGVFNFNAPYLPWVLLGFTLVLNKTFPMHDALGIAFGHVYYYLDDILPEMTGNRNSYLRAPAFFRELFVRREAVPVVPIAAQELHED